MRGTECFVITPAHVVRTAAVNQRRAVVVIGPEGARGKAEFTTAVGTIADDVAVLRVTENAGLVCSERDTPEIRAQKGAVLVARDGELGALTFVSTFITSRDWRAIGLKGDGIAQGMSGSLLVEDGREVGILIGVSTSGGREAEGSQL